MAGIEPAEGVPPLEELAERAPTSTSRAFGDELEATLELLSETGSPRERAQRDPGDDACAGSAAAALRSCSPRSPSSALVLLPLAYLVVRATSGGGRGFEVLWRRSTAELLLGAPRSLVAGVTVAAVAIGVTLAWLVTRTDLPGRRVIGVAAALPLVIPSYVAALCLLGALGPRGLAQQLLGRGAPAGDLRATGARSRRSRSRPTRTCCC